jgi:acetyl-CoA acetyltransferase
VSGTLTASLVGVGAAGPFRPQEREGLYLAADATLSAVADAGLSMRDIDGLVVDHGGPLGPDYDQFAQFLDLRLTSCLQTWSHGRFSTVTVQLAAMMIAAGQATTVACIDGYHRTGLAFGGSGWHGWSEEMRIGGGPHGEDPMVGLTAPLGPAAMAARRYCELYGVNSDELFHVVRAERRNASLNPAARLQGEITREQYMSEPKVVDPLRRADCAIPSEGGYCVIVTTSERAADLRAAPVMLLGGRGIPGGREQFFWGRPGLGMGLQRTDLTPQPETEIFRQSGISTEDVDVFFTYDAFSPLIWFGLERFGFCPPGEAAAFCADRNLSFDGDFPVNTSGGMLCAGSAAGWGHVVEMVSQLRGEAGPRQVPAARTAMWGSCFGDALVLGAG